MEIKGTSAGVNDISSGTKHAMKIDHPRESIPCATQVLSVSQIAFAIQHLHGFQTPANPGFNSYNKWLAVSLILVLKIS